MAAFIFNLIFTLITLISNLISFTVFRLISLFLVLVIQSFKTSGQAVQGVLEQLGGVIKWLFDLILELALNNIWSLVQYVLELAWELAWDSAETTGSALRELASKTREAIGGMMESDPEIMSGLWEMVGSVGGGIWSNCADAVKHVLENA
uniref:Uncharacterized protein n=1 Tax=Kalanchoe fedtschenkoi TaxID=63787 RepID=A0A7N0ZWD1_KALFE